MNLKDPDLDVEDPDRLIEVMITEVKIVPHLDTYLEEVRIGDLSERFDCAPTERAVRHHIDIAADNGWQEVLGKGRYPELDALVQKADRLRPDSTRYRYMPELESDKPDDSKVVFPDVLDVD